MMMATYLERYLNGEYEQVCNELMALGEQVRQEPVYSDAVLVTEEAMRRVRRNIEILIPRLEAIGYKFCEPPLRSPAPNAHVSLAEIEANFAQIPIAWRTCCEIVGGIAFLGEHPDWREDTVALTIDGENLIDDFRDWGEYEDENGDFVLGIHLFVIEEIYGVGGDVPNGAFDAPIAYEGELYADGESLLHYLRTSILRCGGFVGILHPECGGQITHLETLIEGLIPF